jgi:beta-N-acetylhexosaminidase
MLDLVGPTLTAQEREMLLHPQTGGVILFNRNYASLGQLRDLVTSIHAIRKPRLLVGVDQEGGRVQRLCQGFTRLPAPRRLGKIYDHDRRRALAVAESAGWLMAAELGSVGIDFSFAPVLDLDRGLSSVIGDRALHSDPEAVTELARSYIIGMRRAGMAAIGKHFPGHGGVKEDSHRVLPVDTRSVLDILLGDLLPYKRMAHYELAGIMAAHVVYLHADGKLASYSSYWLQDVLRRQLCFQGAIFSDDLNMEAARYAGDYARRAATALNAGCDMVLICNNPNGAADALTRLGGYEAPASEIRLARLHGQQHTRNDALRASEPWVVAQQVVRSVEELP